METLQPARFTPSLSPPSPVKKKGRRLTGHSIPSKKEKQYRYANHAHEKEKKRASSSLSTATRQYVERKKKEAGP